MTSRALVHTSLQHALHHSLPTASLARGVVASSPAASMIQTVDSARRTSSWVPPERRGRDRLFYDKNKVQSNRRPWEVRGKPVPFHVDDLQKVPAARGGLAPLGASSSSAASRYVAPIKAYESDLVVVLDMDECLIHSKFPNSNSPGAGYAHQVSRAAVTPGSKPTAVVDTFTISLPEGDLVRVHRRPFLHEFLQHVSDRYETHIFTAAVPVYADPVLRKLDPKDTIFTKRWYRDSCTFRDGVYMKDLNNLVTASRPERLIRPSMDEMLSRMVLVDNNPLSFLSHPSNGILVANFFDDPHDATLLGLTKVIDELDKVGDVRPELDARFGLQHVVDDIKKRLHEGGDKLKKPKQKIPQQPKPIFNLSTAMLPSTPPTYNNIEQQLQAQQRH